MHASNWNHCPFSFLLKPSSVVPASIILMFDDKCVIGRFKVIVKSKDLSFALWFTYTNVCLSIGYASVLNYIK